MRREPQSRVAFITGASRGIGAESAVALARAGYRVAITARTLSEGESHDRVGSATVLPGSLAATAAAVEKVGGEALCLRGDILDTPSMVAAAEAALQHFGRVDVLFNNAVYQGTGNMEPLLEVTEEQLRAIYQGNVFTPLALVKSFVPGMIKRGSGTVLNMVSHSAFTDPPAAAAIAAVVAWLADNEPPQDWDPQGILRGPAIAKALDLLKSPTLLET